MHSRAWARCKHDEAAALCVVMQHAATASFHALWHQTTPVLPHPYCVNMQRCDGYANAVRHLAQPTTMTSWRKAAHAACNTTYYYYNVSTHRTHATCHHPVRSSRPIILEAKLLHPAAAQQAPLCARPHVPLVQKQRWMELHACKTDGRCSSRLHMPPQACKIPATR
jgi:hypothetical protein